MSQKGKDNNNFKHGCSAKSNLHPLYLIWGALKQRCHNPNNKNYYRYGGRGIKVCELWREDFDTFYNWCLSNGYKRGLTLDRQDNEKGYSPKNCRFVTMATQCRNRGKHHNNKSTSKYKGVGRLSGRKAWRSRVMINGKSIEFSPFKTEIEARDARLKYIKDNNLIDFNG